MSTVVRKRLFALITFALSVVGSAGAASDALGPAFRIIREAVEKDEIPGAIALVARGGTILRHEAYGLRDIENRLPFTTNTLCWIASITKPVTVAAAMTLVDVGKLALDDAIEKYLPEFREQTDTNGTHHVFTIRQLMSHTSGLVPNPPTRRSGWPIGGPLDDFWLQQKLPEIVQTIARSQLRFEPGSQFQYSNSALFVLGRVIEVVSGKPYAVYVKEKILEPLGMVDTHYAPPPTEAKRVATIYARRDGKRETIFRFNPAVMIANTAPDGGLFSYPSQLVPFLQMFLDDDGRVLSRSAVAEMLKEQPHGWGLGWSLQEGLFLHEGSSGTVAWADPKTRVIGVLFLQYRDQNKFDERLRKQFREAVRDAFADPKKPEAYFPPPESEGGWRKLEQPEDIRRLAGMDPDNLAELKKWLLDSDKRDFAAVVIRHGHIALEVERGKSAKTDSPYDQFAIEALFKPIGVEHWWFQYYERGDTFRVGTGNERHPSHGLGMPARLTGEGGRSGAGIPADARAKPGSGGQYIAFVPSLDLVVTRQTGSSGDWQFEEYLRRACAAVLSGTIVTIDPQGNGSSSPKTPPIGATRLRGHAPVEVTRPKHLP